MTQHIRMRKSFLEKFT